MDAKISGKLPDFIVYDIGDRPDLSGGKKAEKTFIGSRIGEINVNGKMEAAVIFSRIPISKLGSFQSRQTRSEAKQAARNAIDHFQQMLIRGGSSALSAAQATNASLISDERLSRQALDLSLFERIAVANIRIPVIDSVSGAPGEIKPHMEVLKEARARKQQGASQSKTASTPLPLSARSDNAKISKPLPAPPQKHRDKTARPAPKPLPHLPSKPIFTSSAPQTSSGASVSTRQANPKQDRESS